MNAQNLGEIIGGLLEPAIADVLTVPGRAVAAEVWHAGETVFRGFYGETDTGGRVDSDTLFDLGAITELVTLTAFLRQVQVGRLWLDTPLSVLLPEIDESLTFYQLITHTSGLPEKTNLTQFESYEERLDALESIKVPRRAENQPPAYSPYDYLLVGLALEALTGLPLEITLAEIVFQPLDLAVCYGPLPSAANVVSGAPRFSRSPIDPDALALHSIAGHNGLFGSLAAVSLLAGLYFKPNGGDAGPFLSSELVREALREHAPMQGLGWRTSETDRIALHTSKVGSVIWGSPERQLQCVVLNNVNADDPELSSRAFHRLLAETLPRSLFDLVE